MEELFFTLLGLALIGALNKTRGKH